jgi:excisionase family DNA binding protein
MNLNLLTVKEASVLLARSERFVLDELRRKNLVGSRYGGGWRIDSRDLEKYVEAHKNVRSVRSA